MGKPSSKINSQSHHFNPSDWEYLYENQTPGSIGTSASFRSKKTGEIVDAYYPAFLSLKDYEYYCQSLQFRRSQPNLVRALYYQPKIKRQLCSTTYGVAVYLEHVRGRLSDYNDIPLTDSLYCMMAMLEGYKKLYEKIGRFFINQDQVIIDDQGEIRVWLNSSLQVNVPEKIDYRQNWDIRGQYEMVEDIITMIIKNTDEVDGPRLKFSDYYQRQKMQQNNRIGFEQAKNIIHEYAKMSGIQIPHAFESVLQIYQQKEDDRLFDNEDIYNDEGRQQVMHQYQEYPMDGQQEIIPVNSVVTPSNVHHNQTNLYHQNATVPTQQPISYQQGSNLSGRENQPFIRNGNSLQNKPETHYNRPPQYPIQNNIHNISGKLSPTHVNSNSFQPPRSFGHQMGFIQAQPYRTQYPAQYNQFSYQQQPFQNTQSSSNIRVQGNHFQNNKIQNRHFPGQPMNVFVHNPPNQNHNHNHNRNFNQNYNQNFNHNHYHNQNYDQNHIPQNFNHNLNKQYVNYQEQQISQRSKEIPQLIPKQSKEENIYQREDDINEQRVLEELQKFKYEEESERNNYYNQYNKSQRNNSSQRYHLDGHQNSNIREDQSEQNQALFKGRQDEYYDQQQMIQQKQNKQEQFWHRYENNQHKIDQLNINSQDKSKLSDRSSRRNQYNDQNSFQSQKYEYGNSNHYYQQANYQGYNNQLDYNSQQTPYNNSGYKNKQQEFQRNQKGYYYTPNSEVELDPQIAADIALYV